MSFRVVLLPLVCVPLSAVAAPVPPDSDITKLTRAYGTWTDPDKDCKFKLDGGELRVTIPASHHMVSKPVEGARNNAPRALREVGGDFTAVVRVVIPIPDRLPDTNWPYCSGGLLAWTPDGHFVVRLCGGRVNGLREAIWGHYMVGTLDHIMVKELGAPTGKAFVRLNREGQKLTAGWSRDGKAWKDLTPVDVAWGAKVKVGVVAESNLGVPVEVTFDQYSLTQPKK